MLMVVSVNLIFGAALVYGSLALAARWFGVRPGRNAADFSRPVTILKPLCGDEPGLLRNLSSFCEQSHGCFQIVFGTNDPHDPALSVVEQLRRRYPHVDMTVSRGCPALGCNLKASNLAHMLRLARHETLIIADSDMRVPHDYLGRVLAPLQDPQTGMVSCLYTSLPPTGPWSRLAGMYIEDWFVPSVLVSRLLGNRLFAFGATMVLTRDTLARIGGFESLANHLADDYIIGLRIRELGLSTVLSECVVETQTSEASAGAMLHHEKRWMQTIRSAQPLGYTFTFITFMLPLGLLAMLLGFGQPLSLSLFVLIAAIRIAIRLLGSRRGVRQAVIDISLIPVRDALTVYVWARGLFGRRIIWRNQQFALGRHGHLKPITSEDKS